MTNHDPYGRAPQRGYDDGPLAPPAPPDEPIWDAQRQQWVYPQPTQGYGYQQQPVDPRQPKAAAKAERARAKAMRPWYAKKRWWLAGGLAAVIAIAALAGGGGDDDGDGDAATGDEPVTNSGNSENPPADDVTVTECAADEVGWIKASGLIVNNSSEPSTYLVSVEFVAGEVRYAEGVFSSSAVAPGQQVEWEASGVTDARDGTTCSLTQVERFAS